MRDFRKVRSSILRRLRRLRSVRRRGPRNPSPAARAIPLLLLSLCVCACSAARRENSPEATVRALSDHLARGELPAAYALMSRAYREHVSFEQFRKQIADNPREAEATSKLLRSPGKTRRVASVQLSDGQTIELEQDKGSWLMTSPVTDFYRQDTPRAALKSFIRAVRMRRWDVLLGLMPERDRQGVTEQTLETGLLAQREELERMVALLEASVNDPIEEVGERASMPYGESYTARFVRENGVWKVEDPE
jgi:hypothetical protein